MDHFKSRYSNNIAAEVSYVKTLASRILGRVRRRAQVGVQELTVRFGLGPLCFWLDLANEAPIYHNEIQQLGARVVIGNRWYDEQFPP